MSRSWNEQMRLMYMRLRRIVISHTEMQMEYAQYRREVNMRPNLQHPPKKPVNSVYTGYGEVGNVFYYYGAMNEGAYINKFDTFAMDLQLFDDNFDEDALSRVDIPFVGLWIVVELTCPLYLAPMEVLRKLRRSDDQTFSRSSTDALETENNEEIFDMKVTFHYPGAFYPRLPTNNVVHIVDKR